MGSTGELNLNIRHGEPESGAAVVLGFGDGLELYHQAGSFGMNLAKAMLMLWFRLSFLAMLGLTAATFLSFPVAVVLAVLVLLVASGSSFLLEAADKLESAPDDQVSLHLDVARVITKSAASLFHRYATYAPTERIVGGIHIAWNDVLGCFVWIAFVWTGLMGLIGWGVFRSAELARIQV